MEVRGIGIRIGILWGVLVGVGMEGEGEDEGVGGREGGEKTRVGTRRRATTGFCSFIELVCMSNVSSVKAKQGGEVGTYVV